MRQFIFRAAVLYALTCGLGAGARAQQQQQQSPAPPSAAPEASPASGPKLSGSIYGIEEMRKQLREQHDEIDELRAALKEQSRLIGELRSRVEQTAQQVATQQQTATQTAGVTLRDATYKSDADASSVTAGSTQDAELEDRVTKVEAQSKKTSEAVTKQIGSMTFGGDMRFRYE